MPYPSSLNAPAALLKLKALPRQPPLPPEREWVFALQADLAPPLVRIASSRHLRWSVLAAQYSSPVGLKLIAIAKAPAGTERVLRAKFREFSQHGGWFFLHEQLRAFLAGLPKGGEIPMRLVQRWSVETAEPMKPRRARRPSAADIQEIDDTLTETWSIPGPWSS